jgi:subtilisin family serine protease
MPTPRPHHLAALAGAVAIAATLAGGAAASTAESGPPAGVQRASGAEYVPGQVIVGFRAGVGSAQRARTLHARGARTTEKLAGAGATLVTLRAGTSVLGAVAALRRDPSVLYAEPNYVYHALAVPNDTLYGTLYGLPKISAPAAWDVTTGRQQTLVAVVDTGVAYDHPDLAANIWTNPKDPAGGGDQDHNGLVDDIRGWDFIQNDNKPLDANEHGTHVAGTVAARGNNSLGVVGVNWKASIMALRAGDATGSFPNSAIINAFAYACSKKARVVNGSFGGGTPSSATQAVITSAACSQTLFVFAAGNGGSDGVGDDNDSIPQYPCSYPSTRIICVAATDQTDTLTGFSNFGLTSVDIAAPGADINSTIPTFQTVVADGFDDTPTTFASRWGSQGGTGTAWGHETFSFNLAPFNFSISDSPGANYLPNSDTTIRSLSSYSTAGLSGCALDYWMNLATELGVDFVSIEMSTSSGGPWTDVTQGGWSGSTGPSTFFLFTEDATAFDNKATVFIRFRLQSDADGEFNGARIEDMVFRCVGAPAPGGSYAQLDGTSMASPHVAGVAALVLSKNWQLTTAQLRTAILSSGDAVAGLAGKIATGDRVNVAAALAAVGPPDLTKPQTTITKFTKSGKKATVKFKSNEAGSTFQCKLDGGAWKPCKSPKTYKNLKKGNHTIRVRAIDKFGNVDGTPAKKTFRI